MPVLKPSAKTDWTVGNPNFATVTIEPSGAKKTTGWQASEKPGFQTMNWIQYITDQWVDYFEDPQGQILSITAATHNASSLNRWIACDTSTFNITVNLPGFASNSGVQFLIVKTTSDARTVTIDGNGTELINNQLTRVLTSQYDFAIIKQMAGGWVVIASKSGSIETRLVTGTTTLTAADNGRVILINSSGGSFNITLPGPFVGFNVSFKGISGLLNLFPVTLARFGAESIEGLAQNYVLEAPFGSWSLITNATDWFIQ